MLCILCDDMVVEDVRLTGTDVLGVEAVGVPNWKVNEDDVAGESRGRG